MPGVTEQLARGVSRISYDDLSPAMIHKTKQFLADSIGCTLAGHIVDRGRIALELVADLGERRVATIIGHGRTSWSLAAFANGELMNALDYDAVGPMIGHVVPFVLPPTIAMAERANISGRELLTAAAIAIEVGGRMGSSVPGHRVPVQHEPGGPTVLEDNERFTYTVTIFGGVAGAAKALRMSPEKLVHALGVAGINIPAATANKWEFTGGPAPMTKYGTNPGFVSQLATNSVLLAEKGFTADDGILDGEWSLKKIFGVAFYKPEKIVDGLGEVWHSDLMSIKGYPCCGADHIFIQTVNKVVAENAIRPEEIEGIVVQGDPFYLTPNRAQEAILTYADSQFAHAYLIGGAPFHGQNPSPAWQMPETYKDPRIVAMMKKVVMEAHPAPAALKSGPTKEGGWSQSADAHVEIRARGRVYTGEGSPLKGSGANPFSDDDVMAKFLSNARYSRLHEARAREAFDMVYRLEDVGETSELMAVLRAE